MLTGQGRFDLSTSDVFKYALRHDGAKSIVVEVAADGNGNSFGSVAVYLGEAIGAAPWFSVKAGTVRVYPSPETDFVSIVPSSGARGICTVSLSQENLGVGIYPFDGGSGGGGGASPTLVQISTLGRTNGGGGGTVTFATPPSPGNAIVFVSCGWLAAGDNCVPTSPIGYRRQTYLAANGQGVSVCLKLCEVGESSTIVYPTFNDVVNALAYEVSGMSSFTPSSAFLSMSGSRCGPLIAAQPNALVIGAIEQGGSFVWSAPATGMVLDTVPPTSGNHFGAFYHGTVSGGLALFDLDFGGATLDNPIYINAVIT